MSRAALEDRHAGVVAPARLGLDVEQVVLHRLHALLVGDRASGLAPLVSTSRR